MNTTTKIQKQQETDREIVGNLWRAKLQAERDMALLIAQDRNVEADATWDRILVIASELRRYPIFDLFAGR